ncbi:MAG: hypothetical protein CVV36_01805 [Candidatus Methanoperedenaceae archaeon HGW-Methanoperedenaceae-1]|nr:MAG: hypothetical protein CVV36_01805 [Candidatus Methanoperedenaceae archaeon HGW-Methanoperedenaceae-1]
MSEGYGLLSPILLYVAGMVIYAVFIFKFYRFLARKDIFELDLQKYNTLRFAFLRKTVRAIIHVFKFVLFLPILVFLWFGGLTVLLVFLAKEQPIENILLVSLTVVSSIRVTAYYTEDLSKDLAKMLPFALLGVLIVDASYFSLWNSIGVLLKLISMWKILVYYLVFLIILELALKIVSHVIRLIRPKRSEELS